MSRRRQTFRDVRRDFFMELLAASFIDHMVIDRQNPAPPPSRTTSAQSANSSSTENAPVPAPDAAEPSSTDSAPEQANRNEEHSEQSPVVSQSGNEENGSEESHPHCPVCHRNHPQEPDSPILFRESAHDSRRKRTRGLRARKFKSEDFEKLCDTLELNDEKIKILLDAFKERHLYIHK